MRNDNLFLLLFCGLWCLVGIVLAAVGLLMRRSWKRREVRLSAQTVGQIVSLSLHHSRGSGNSNTNWYPIVAFLAGRQRIIQESEQGHAKHAFYKGQRVEVYYDPDDPTVFRLEGEEASLSLGTILAVVGAAAFAIGLVILIVTRTIG